MSKCAAAQMVSVDDVETNLTTAAQLIRQAAEQGAGLVALPENFAFLGRKEGEMNRIAEHFGAGKIQDFLAEQAVRHDIWILAGTVPLRAEDDLDHLPEKVFASSLLIDAEGSCVARYDKIHLFDVELPGKTKESYRESSTYFAGNKIVVADTPFGKIGLSICYDLRFPELYRALIDRGVEILTVPSAFTEATGKVHWDTLIKARAVENQCFVIAPDQGGIHPGGRRTHGGSQIVDPWGETLTRVGKGAGLAIADIDLDHLHDIRERFPALKHRCISVNS